MPNRRIDVPSGRGPVVVIAIHSTSCAECRSFIDDLSGHADSMADWNARLMVSEDTRNLPVRAPGVMIADEWGEVFFEKTADHQFLPVADVLDWVRFIAIQCPECEQPEGAWREL